MIDYTIYGDQITLKSLQYCLTLAFSLQKKKACAKSESTTSEDLNTLSPGMLNKDGLAGSRITITVDSLGEDGDAENDIKDDDNADSTDEDISTLEEQLRKIDLSLEKLQIEYQRDLEVPGICR